MIKKYDIMVAGHLCLDIIPYFPSNGVVDIADLIRPGKLINVQHAVLSTGGPVSNTGITMKTLGMKVCFCARVGDDEFGRIVINQLRSNGNAKGIRTVKEGVSSYTIVLAPPNIDRIFLHNPAANDQFSPEDINEELLAQCRHFHFGYPPLMKKMYENGGDNLLMMFQIAKQAGATTSCDMSLPDPTSASGMIDWREILEKVLPYVDLFLPSLEETLFMLDRNRFTELKLAHNGADLIDCLNPDDYTQLADQLLALGSKIVSLKTGHRGFYLKTASENVLNTMGKGKPSNCSNWSNRELWAPAYRVPKFGSATGSGDASIAGFLSAYLRGESVENSLKYAVGCGMQNIMVLDAVSGARSWEETTDTILKKPQILEFEIDAFGWTWSPKYLLWAGPGDPLSEK